MTYRSRAHAHAKVPPHEGRPVGRSVRRGLLAALLLVFVTAGCAIIQGEAGNSDPFGPGGGEDNQNFTILVENQNFHDARVYAVWNGDRQRLGNVTGNSDERFQIRVRGQQLRLEVDFIAAGGFTSEIFTPSPGESLRFRIPPSAR